MNDRSMTAEIAACLEASFIAEETMEKVDPSDEELTDILADIERLKMKRSGLGDPAASASIDLIDRRILLRIAQPLE